jgi:hypothetical protein
MSVTNWIGVNEAAGIVLTENVVQARGTLLNETLNKRDGRAAVLFVQN